MSSVLRAQMAAVHVTLNFFQGPDPAGWMLKPVQHDVIPAELNSFVQSTVLRMALRRWYNDASNPITHQRDSARTLRSDFDRNRF